MRRRMVLASIGGVGVVGPAISGCSGAGDENREDEPERMRWVHESPGLVRAVSDEMIVSFTRGTGGLAISALDAETGDRLWISEEHACGGGGGCHTAPTITDAIYLGSDSDTSGGGAVSALNADSGELLWERTSAGVAGSMRVFEEVLFVRHRNSLKVLETETGETIWSSSLDESQSFPPISSNTVYLSDGRHLFGLDPTDGRERWRYTSDEGRISLASVIDDIAFCRADKTVMAVDEGEQRWATGFDEEIEIFPNDSETLIVGSPDWSRLRGVDATNGEQLWSTEFEEGISILLSEDEYLIVSNKQSRLHRVDARTGRKQWVIEGTYPRHVKAIDERLYTVDDPGKTLSAINFRTGSEAWTRQVSEDEHIDDIYVIQESHSSLDHSVYLQTIGPVPDTLYQYGPSGDLVWAREFAGDIGSVTFEECLYVGTDERTFAFDLL